MISSISTDAVSTRDAAKLIVRRAQPTEAGELSKVAYVAKAWWGYSEQQMRRWHAELTIDGATIVRQPTFVAIVDTKIVGFHQVELEQPESTLNHLWVNPAFMRKGVGKALLYHASRLATDGGADRLLIDSDPHAEIFYRLCGALKTAELAAPITGQPERTRPQLVMQLPPQ